MYTEFWSENLKGRDHSKDLGIDRRITSEWILEKIGREGVNCMHLAQDKDQWQATVKKVMNLQVS
jgi:hypothetical protein